MASNWTVQRTAASSDSDNSQIGVVRKFLDKLAAGEVDEAVDLLAEDVVYENVSLPTIRTRERVRSAFKFMQGLRGAGFEVYIRSASSDGTTVLTERTDVLYWGLFRMQIWVCGRFDVTDGKISLWRDYFDWLNATIALLRGLLGMVFPALRPVPPAVH